MEIFFKGSTPSQVINELENIIKKKNLPVKASFEEKQNQIWLKLSKFGTTILKFTVYPQMQNDKEGFNLTLFEEDIASLHKPYIEDVKKQIEMIVAEANA